MSREIKKVCSGSPPRDEDHKITGMLGGNVSGDNQPVDYKVQSRSDL